MTSSENSEAGIERPRSDSIPSCVEMTSISRIVHSSDCPILSRDNVPSV